MSTSNNDDFEPSRHYKELIAKGYEFSSEYFDEYVEDRMVHSCRHITNPKFAIITSIFSLIGIIGIIGITITIWLLVHLAIQYCPI